MPQCCCECQLSKVLANLSAAASVIFFGLTIALMLTLYERSMILFIMSVIYCVETLLFFKYYIDVVFLYRPKFRWHANRVWVPLADLCTVTIAAAIAFNLLELDEEGSLLGQLEAFSVRQIVAASAACLGLLLKLVTALLLTGLHIRLIKLQPSSPMFDTMASLNAYPFRANAPASDK